MGPFIEEEDRLDGAHVSAYEALDIITVQKEKIADLEKQLRELDHKYRIACDVRDIQKTKLLQIYEIAGKK
jgi:hypothetical protein